MTEKAEIWSSDLLNRKMDALLLEEFLVRRHEERVRRGEHGAYVLNLNASWGVGKTFFLERLQKQLEASGHPVAFVNAWKDDASQEPVIAVMAAIEKSLKPYFAENRGIASGWSTIKVKAATIVATLVKGALKKAAARYFGDGPDKIKEIFEHTDALPSEVEEMISDGVASAGIEITDQVTTLLTKYIDDKMSAYQARIDSANEFQSRMAALLELISVNSTAKLPLFVLIDELDRCRPTYAIEMLEQVKHLFNIDHVVFVIATDSDQLAHSVRAVYGEGFNGARYLNRFFHRHYKFEKRSLEVFVSYLFERYEIDQDKLAVPVGSSPVGLFVSLMQAQNISLREADQCFDIFRSAVTIWDEKVPIHVVLMFPLVVMMHNREYDQMKSFLQGVHDYVSPWRFHAEYWDKKNHHGVMELDANRFVQALIRAAAGGVDLRQEPQDVFDAYAQRAMAAEYSRYGQHSGDGANSLVFSYESIVRQVGRLAAPAEDSSLETVS